MKLTISAIKADVGSVGGHTKPSDKMVKAAHDAINTGIEKKLILDGYSFYTGDDIALIMTHTHGNDSPEVHEFALSAFKEVTKFADECGCYGAGQDLRSDAPSSNVRGAGPGVAEITFDYTRKSPRKAESFMIWLADKCSPGAYNLPLFLAFADPMYCSGLMLPNFIKGFSFDIIDMSKHSTDKCIIEKVTLHAPEDYYKIVSLLRDNDRFGIASIYSRTYEEQVVSTSTDRLHAINGKFIGKDDPIAIIRNHGYFPAPEEIISPLVKTHYVSSGTRGAHNMPLMPVPINTPVTGFYFSPIISCVGFSVTPEGRFSDFYTDFFDNPAWDFVRIQAQEKALAIRNQGWSGPAMLPYGELEYSGFNDTLTDVLKNFKEQKSEHCKS